MSHPDNLEFLIRIALATACGAVIGVERQYRSRTAGLRTNTLVAAGAAAFVLVGEQTVSTVAPVQITAYVVSGVGFLGGGVILRQGFSVQGLNTAATLWCSAAVGCEAATGHLVPALIVTAVVLAVHLFLRPVGRLIDHAPAGGEDDLGSYVLTVDVRRKHEPHLRAQLMQSLNDSSVSLRGLSSRSADEDPDTRTVLAAELVVEGDAARPLDALVSRLSLEAGVRAVAWSSRDSDLRDEDDRDDGAMPRARLRRWHRGDPA